MYMLSSFCFLLQTYNSIKKTDDFDSDKYKLVEVLGGMLL
jgi:hypothetical protein